MPGPRFELGTTTRNNEKTLFMRCDKGQMSKYGAFKKLPYHFHISTFLERLFFVSYLRVIGMEVLRTWSPRDL